MGTVLVRRVGNMAEFCGRKMCSSPIKSVDGLHNGGLGSLSKTLTMATAATTPKIALLCAKKTTPINMSKRPERVSNECSFSGR